MCYSYGGGIAFIAIIMLALSLFGNLSESEMDEKALKMVQNGYLGSYDTVTVQEVFTYACPKIASEDSGIWEWNGGFTDDNENIIEYHLEDENRIQFTVMPEYQGFEISTLITKGKTLNTASEVKDAIDMMYIVSTVTPESTTQIVDVEGVIVDNKINFTYYDDIWGSSGEGVIELEVDPEIKYMLDLIIEETDVGDYAIGSMNTEKISLWNIQLEESLGVVGG